MTTSEIKKGICPVSFLWRGEGLGVYLMIPALVAIFIGVMVQIMLLWMHKPMSFRTYFGAALSMWLLGKALCLISRKKNGAQKRTRTSTK